MNLKNYNHTITYDCTNFGNSLYTQHLVSNFHDGRTEEDESPSGEYVTVLSKYCKFTIMHCELHHFLPKYTEQKQQYYYNIWKTFCSSAPSLTLSTL